MTDTLSGPEQVNLQASYDISDVVRQTGLSAHTLRYYERAGLLQNPQRDAVGRRRYSPEDVSWLVFLTKLRSTGMPIRVVRAYIELCWAGDGNEPDRLAILLAHRQTVRDRLEQAQRDLEHIDFKIDLYRKAST